jgi:hypothetical protein
MDPPRLPNSIQQLKGSDRASNAGTGKKMRPILSFSTLFWSLQEINQQAISPTSPSSAL